MARALVTLFLLTVLSCSSATVPQTSATRSATPFTAPSATVTPTLRPVTATPVPLATSTATNYAVVCGTVSDFVRTTPTTNGSAVLNSPGRTPIKITLTAARINPEGSFGNYVCMALDEGVPYPIFAGLGVPGREGYVAEGTYPATLAKPAPAGFVVPQACAFVRPPETNADQTYWWADCGAQLNRDARGTLGTALVQQGWTRCGPAAATESFFNGTLRVVVVESSLAPGDYPRFSQRPGTGCG